MSKLTDYKYVSLVSSRLEKYKVSRANPLVSKFRCHICGDSQSNKNATKAYFLDLGQNTVFFKCHKCALTLPFAAYLKQHWPDLYGQYTFEEYSEKKQLRVADPILTYTKPKSETTVLKKLKRISQLPADHKAKTYVMDRQIPTVAHSQLYFVLNFKSWINELVPGKYPKPPDLDPRLVMPFLDKDGGVFAIQGRSLAKNPDQRYITIRLNDNIPKIFGLDKVDPNYKTYVLEGPIDSLFLPNAVAMAGSDCSVEDLVKHTRASKDRLVFVFDNEPRNVHIHRRMEAIIKKGYNVCVWPSYVKEKDINKMITDSGMNAFDIQLIIDRHTYSGLEAELQMASWIKS